MRWLLTLSIGAVVGAICGWPLAWLMATIGGRTATGQGVLYGLGMEGYSSLDVILYSLGMGACLGLLVGALICGVQAAVRTGRAGGLNRRSS